MASNGANMCFKCLPYEVDITAEFRKQVAMVHSFECDTFLQPPGSWIKTPLELNELLAFYVGRLKNLNKLRTDGVDAVIGNVLVHKTSCKGAQILIQNVKLELAYIVKTKSSSASMAIWVCHSPCSCGNGVDLEHGCNNYEELGYLTTRVSAFANNIAQNHENKEVSIAHIVVNQTQKEPNLTQLKTQMEDSQDPVNDTQNVSLSNQNYSSGVSVVPASLDWVSAKIEPNVTKNFLAKWLAPGGEPRRDAKTVEIAIPGLDGKDLIVCW
ncbi:hypothetical protein ACLB2K_041974 [Fragaria x ananassa]